MTAGISKYYTQTVVFETAATSSADAGYTQVWSTAATVKGRLRPLSGRERMSADKQTLYADHRLYCAPVAITEKDRVACEGKTFDIVFVKNVMSMNRHLEIDLLLRGHENAI